MSSTVLTFPGIGNSGPRHWQSLWEQSNPDGSSFPAEAVGFSPLPMQQFSFPSIVVASTNDPYGSNAHAQACASAWGCRLVTIGAAGHINADSGLGQWLDGYELLQQLCG